MSSPLTLFPQRIAIGKVNIGGRDVPVHISPEFFRALQELLRRVGGESSEVPELNQFFLEATMGQPVSQDDIAAGAMMFGQGITQPSGSETSGDCSMVLGQVAAAVVIPPEVMAHAVADQSALPPQLIAVGPSPMSIRADRRCAVHVNGTPDAVKISRAGVVLDVTGVPIIELNLGDVLTVEYTTAPTLTLIPR